MRRLLKRVVLDAARHPLSMLVREDWIWRGEQTIDGLYVARNIRVSSDWRLALVRHLPNAATVLESGDSVIVLFRDPQRVDCDRLGHAVPLKQQHGALSSFPFKASQSRQITDAIDGTLLILRDGTIHQTSLADYREANLAAWYDASDVMLEKGAAPPRRPGVPDVASMKTSGDTLFDNGYSDAGLQSIRKAVDQIPDTRSWGDLIRPAMKPMAIMAITVAAMAMFLSGTLPTSDVAYSVLAVVAILIGLMVLRLIAGQRRASSKTSRTPTRPKPTTQPSGSAWLPVTAGVVGALVVAVAASNNSVSDVVAIVLSILFAVGLLGLLGWIGGHIGIWTTATSADSAPKASEPPVTRKHRGKGLLSRLFDKLLQNTPLADLALGKYERRVAELKRLFEQGKVEEALKKSLALGEQKEANTDVHADAPITGPGIRERLQIQARREESSHFLAALPDGAREELEALYRQQAELCVTNQDYERAAFIFAELLDDAEAAVKVFSDAEKFAVAAKLAQGRRLSPTLFIPLWYHAGELERALRLAERHDAYELLLEATEESDESFRRVVREAWSIRLAAIGNYTTALTISQPIAKEDAAFQTKRREWLAQGLAATPTDADLIARAAKALALDDGLESDAAMSAFQQLLQQRNAEAARQRFRLAELLLMPDFENKVDASFHPSRLPIIADQLVRQLLVDHSQYGLLNSHQILGSLADAGGQTTLAADIRRLPAVSKSKSAVSRQLLDVGPMSGAKAVVTTAAMRAGQLLLAYEDGSIQLLDARNEIVWQDQLWSPQDIVPINPGRFAIIIRDEPSERRLSILDTETLRHADIGPLNLEAWATTASSQGWLVYTDKHVLNLRLDQLLSPLSGGSIATLEYHWSTPITIDGRMRALLRDRDSGDSLWLFERDDGVVERWCITQRDLNVSYWALSFTSNGDTPVKTTNFQSFDWIGANDHRQHLNFSLAPPDQIVKPDVVFPKLHVSNGRLRPEQHECLPAAVAESETPGIALMSDNHSVVLHLVFQGARDVAMRDSFNGDAVIMLDDLGRVIKVDTETAKITFSNVSARDAGMNKRTG